MAKNGISIGSSGLKLSFSNSARTGMIIHSVTVNINSPKRDSDISGIHDSMALINISSSIRSIILRTVSSITAIASIDQYTFSESEVSAAAGCAGPTGSFDTATLLGVIA